MLKRRLLLLVFVPLILPVDAETPDDRDTVRQVASDYLDAWYSGSVEEMERVLHSDLAKRRALINPETGILELSDQNVSSLIQLTKEGIGTRIPPARRRNDVTVLDVYDNSASVRIDAAAWVEYLHLLRWDGEWKIVNVLWQMRPSQAALSNPPNILVIIADDLGTEALTSYGIGNPTASTPNIDSLASRGIRFEGFWSQPSCSPARSAILTGRYAFRTGVNQALLYQWAKLNPPNPVVPNATNKEIFYTRGRAVDGQDYVMKSPPSTVPKGPSKDELLLPAAIKSISNDYATAAVGKWHLADLNNGSLKHPNESGFDYYSGALFGSPANYSAWRHVENGIISAESGYIDARAVKDALRWVNTQGNRPWFLWFSFSNPHTPVHKPPEVFLHSEARELDPELTGNNNQPYFLAQVEAMDTLLGRLLASIPESILANTYIIFLGDNGTDKVAQPPSPRVPGRVKGTLYQGGIEVPLIIVGPGVEGGRVERNLAHAVDLFSTIIELAGGDISMLPLADRVLDSVSLVPQILGTAPATAREWVLSESARGFAIRDADYKLIVKNGSEEFFNLVDDPNELSPLAQKDRLAPARASYATLKSQLAELLGPEKVL